MPRKRRILVVDDEASIRMLVRTVLEHAGYEVTTARDGREAIALLAASDYDVVLLDVVMTWSLVVSPWSLVVRD